MINALTIDLEYWYSNEFLLEYLPEKKQDYVEESVKPILTLLNKYNTKATFFVLGSLAENHPQLIEKIYDMGHEIASHSYSHKTLYDLGRNDFEDEIKKSVRLLEFIVGEKPIGFRAPCFSFDNDTKWMLEILEKYGFEYDSSIFPIKTMLYGVSNAPVGIYRPSKNDVSINDPNGNIVEFPLTTLKIIKNIPISGGFYLRVLPTWFLRYGFKKVNKERPGVLYLHPWETNTSIPQLNISLFGRFVTYYGIKNTLKKLELLIKEFNFKPMREVLDEI